MLQDVDVDYETALDALLAARGDDAVTHMHELPDRGWFDGKELNQLKNAGWYLPGVKHSLACIISVLRWHHGQCMLLLNLS